MTRDISPFSSPMKFLRLILLLSALSGIAILLVIFRVPHSQTILSEESKIPIPNSSETAMGQKTEPSFNFSEHSPAPELSGLSNWINSPGFSSIQELKGKVVLVDFWTYSCVNCIRTLPYLESWYEKYADQGLVILGIHTPEFAFEHIPENVQAAVKKYGISYPVAQDNDFSTWKNYQNHYWPAKYLIDKDGFIRYTHFGEGEYDETEKAIVALLGTEEKGGEVMAETVDFQKIKTKETYLGKARRMNFVPNATDLKENEWTTTGKWKETEESIVSEEAGATLRLVFHATKANLVLGGEGSIEVWIDGKPASMENAGRDVTNGTVQLDGSRLYELSDFGERAETHSIELRFHDVGIEAFAWTFG